MTHIAELTLHPERLDKETLHELRELVAFHQIDLKLKERHSVPCRKTVWT